MGYEEIPEGFRGLAMDEISIYGKKQKSIYLGKFQKYFDMEYVNLLYEPNDKKMVLKPVKERGRSCWPICDNNGHKVIMARGAINYLQLKSKRYKAFWDEANKWLVVSV